MDTVFRQAAFPAPALGYLDALDPEAPVLALLAASGHGSSRAAVLERVVAPLYTQTGAVEDAISSLIRAGSVARSKAGLCRITENGRREAERRFGSLLGQSWDDVRARCLAALPLGLNPANLDARLYLARRENLESAALARLYGLRELGPMPSRMAVRAALLRAFVVARIPECEPAFTETLMRNSSRDAVGRVVMLGAAGLKRGSLREAETALLRKALGLPQGGRGGVAEAVIRASLAKNIAKSSAAPKAEIRIEKLDLAAFAASVRDLAKTQQTHPFAGRVAIAQVYDAGVSRGLAFGSLEDFKARVAEACRAGLLDLERYDVAGPMDHALRERSRTPFGRDERHFIVNEWI